MDCGGLEKGIEELKVNKEKGNLHAHEQAQGQLQITTFSELVNDVGLHFQIIRFPKQVFPHQTLFLFQLIQMKNKIRCHFFLYWFIHPTVYFGSFIHPNVYSIFTCIRFGIWDFNKVICAVNYNESAYLSMLLYFSSLPKVHLI